MRLAERTRGDIHFAERDRELLAQLRDNLKRVKKTGNDLRCPKCRRLLNTYTLYGFVLDRCGSCGGIWIDQGELEGLVSQISPGTFQRLGGV